MSKTKDEGVNKKAMSKLRISILVPTIIAILVLLFFGMLQKEIELMLLSEKVVEKAGSIDMITEQADRFVLHNGKWDENYEIYLDTLLGSVEMIDRLPMTYAAVFDHALQNVSARSPSYEGSPFEPNADLGFIQAVQANDSGDYELPFTPPGAEERTMYIHYRWLPSDAATVNRFLVVVAISRFTINTRIATWTHIAAIGFVAAALVLTLFLWRKQITESLNKKLAETVKQRTEELEKQTGEVIQIQLEKQQAEQATQAKSQFLSHMSHEIRTPMNSIMGFAELALDYTVAPQARDYLNKIVDNTKQLLHIINDILDISKVESGKLELECIPFELHPIFTRCQSVMQPDAAKKNIDLRVYAEPTTGKRILGDPVRLQQVLMNLLANAVKFTDKGKVLLSSTVKSLSDGKAVVYFEIRDEGIGMTDEQVERIFEPFMQADSSTTRNYGGTGLGLPICKSTIELMGGELVVHSKLGEGSTFSFELTFDTVDALDQEDEKADEYKDIPTDKRPHFTGLVLVCEDNLMNQRLITDHLARVGLQTVVADNGKIGVDMVQERLNKGLKPFDMILMDMFMPVMDGVEAADEMTKLHTGTPIVAVTANVMTSEIENYKRHGMIDYLGKPYTTQELWRCLLRQLTPIRISSQNPEAQMNDSEVLLLKLKKTFVRNNQTKWQEISDAIAASDFTLAHRLAHTLKGNAGLLGRTELQGLAAGIEGILHNEKCPTPEEMTALKYELDILLDELHPLLEDGQKKPATANISKEEALKVLNELEPLLKTRSPESLNLLEAVRKIPDTQALQTQIEGYDFKIAAQTLSEIKNRWE